QALASGLRELEAGFEHDLVRGRDGGQKRNCGKQGSNHEGILERKGTISIHRIRATFTPCPALARQRDRRRDRMKALLAVLAVVLVAQADSDLARRASILKPKPGEYKWQQIPWILDLNEGIRLAREEKRPVLVWASGDDPLERC